MMGTAPSAGRVAAGALAVALSIGACGAPPDPPGAVPSGASGRGGSPAAAGTGGGIAGTGGSSGGGGSLGGRQPNRGPGVPRVTFADAELFQVCATVDGGDTDQDHHNFVSMYDGYMVMPWAHEAGGGGISFYDLSQPCAPRRIGVGLSDEMRESHTIAISNVAGGRWMFTAQRTVNQPGGGIQVWDIADVTAPRPVAKLDLEGHSYPGSYDYVVLAIAPQGRYLYVAAGFLGIFIVDIADPLRPALVRSYQVTPPLRAMQVIPVGNRLFASAAEGARVLLLDISDPTSPQPIPGGDFNVTATAGGGAVAAYSSNFSGGYGYFARQAGAGGLVIYDLRNPRQPMLAGAFTDDGGNGGYVSLQGAFAFVGNSSFYSVYDIADPAAIRLVNKMQLQGDQDTVTVIGNLAILSVDDGAVDGQASAIAPWASAPDVTPPVVTWSAPGAGETGLARGAPIGVTFSEAIDQQSAWRPDAVRLFPTALGRAAAVAGAVTVLDTVLNFSPAAALDRQTEYTFEIVAGGVEDLSGNAVTQAFTTTFTTGG
jgi:hypothetical protein